MRKSVWIFLLAVLIPSAVLGWLALRSAAEQRIILERRTAELYQHETEALASAARATIDEQRRGFRDAVRALLTDNKPGDVAGDFAGRLAEAWPRKAVGFAIGPDGQLLSPINRTAATKPEWKKFLRDQSGFLSGDIAASVYNVPVDALTQPEVLRKSKLAALDNEGMAANRSSSLGRSQSDSIDATTSKDVRLEPSKGRTDSFGKKGALAKAKEVPADKPTEALASSEREKLLAKSEFKLEPKLARSRSKSDKPDVVERSLLERISEQDAVKLAEPPAAAAPLQAPRAAPSPFADEALTVSGTAGAVVQAQPDDSAVLEQAKKIAENEARRRADWQLRQVMPQQNIDAKNQAAWSAVAPETAEFRALCEGLNEGIVARFVQDKLSLIFWLRPAQAPEFILGCVVDAADFADLWPAVLSATKSRSDDRPEFVLALLDDKARPVFTSADGKNGRDWKKPFVASEIGEALPHWEAALYLMRPEQIHESAIGLRRTLTFLVVAMLGAIALGGWLVVADARRQLALAQQKTDFVSNVSHELKTPLTSIRMFAELMLGARSGAHEKAPQYLRIIMVEAERLTRLINNVLDFAKLERRQKRFDKKPIDLHEVIERIWESQELHLRESGFSTRWIAAPPPYRVIGDEDALAQVLVNLLSNAEKYSAERKEIELHSYLDEGLVCVSVLDRGMGVPESETGKIFEAFYRAHDSLSSGIQGSGLGLTLAQRLAREHDGEVRYRAREGGGSDFTLRLPLDEPPRASSDVR